MGTGVRVCARGMRAGCEGSGASHARVVLHKTVAWSGELDVTLVGIILVGGMEFAMVALLIVLAAVVLLAVVLVASATIASA